MSENDQHFCMTPAAPKPFADVKAAFPNATKWQPGDTITVRFLGGSAGLRQRVRDVAKQWQTYANLTLSFVDSGAAQIRIAFVQGNGSWSYVGTDCQHIIDQHEPTMNYGWLTDASPEDELRRVVLHEFGHAIGLIHEHQNPEGGIRWNKPAVIHDLSGPPNNWDEATIETNMFRVYSGVDATNVDSTSIMMYPIPASWTEGGYFSAGLNSTLSATDKQKTEEVYPR
uniref:matrixin family metalloprotease n=1 Tax=uncultured Sphingomonas sp. TaxID=158754 RepID=UPI0035CA25DE